MQAAQAQAASYTSSASTGNQLYRQRKHRQSVIHAAQAQATQAQATSYTGSASTGLGLGDLIFRVAHVAMELTNPSGALEPCRANNPLAHMFFSGQRQGSQRNS